MVAPDLLHLHFIPLKLNIRVKPGELKYDNASAQIMVTRQRGGFQMKSTPGELHIDTFEARSSIRPTVMQAVKQNAQKGKQAAADAAATYAQQGKRAMEAPIGEELITQFVKEAQFKNVKTNIGLDFIPKAPAKISYTPRDLEMTFQADRLQFNARLKPIHFDYVPADVDISVAQHPEVQITYTGSPLYVPRSADPIDIRA